jgi:hypothetical protein
MPQKQNQEPLAGGLLAGILQAEHAVDIRKTLRNQASQRLKRQHLVERVNSLHSSRVWFEFVDEVVRHHPEIADDIDRRLERYARLDATLLCAVGGDKFAPSPVRLVGGAS